MRLRARLIVAGLLAATPAAVLMAQDSPESLLPPGFDEPAPAPAPAPAPRPTPAPRQAPAQPRTPAPVPAPSTGEAVSRPVVQEVPGASSAAERQPSRAEAAREMLDRLPSLEELEAMDPDELDELLGLKPTFDIPPAARRSSDRVGLLDREEGGMGMGAVANTRALFVRNVLRGTRGPLVSRWGHIALRRALASRMAPPAGMDGMEFAALRAGLLNRLGEPVVARALVQEVDTADYTQPLISAAYDAYVGTGDFTGACPMMRLHGATRDDEQWELWRALCSTYSGESGGMDRIERVVRRGGEGRFDALLAQKYAGAVGRQRRAVTLEWDEVDALTPWRYALATATGAQVPEGLSAAGGPQYRLLAALSPSVDIVTRAAASDLAARRGIFSSTAMVDLYSQIYDDTELSGDQAARAALLREAYVGTPAQRLDAMQDIWGDGEDRYARQVLTAYAAARMPVNAEMADAAGDLIASMLAAGLDRNALRWAGVVPVGSSGWAQLALAAPGRGAPVEESGVRSFMENDGDGLRSRLLVAGLAGLDRMSAANAQELSGDMGFDLSRQTAWTRAIARAGERRNAALVTMLAGLGMQGSSWSKMTPLHLYHIVSAMKAAGLEAEARMIAAEAVARA
ncbi:hypothetical protein [Croceicoccus marinus]|jgi:hypothetical protein|uniref:Uncharacterized protein n=1 Tax=Croceicoccus marinus TaxID=450378 RepID=A0A7G6VWP3_9SPHN|nr:hypothetical protein [Croceicoccus marinus]QNE06158.1 hypothetical protein H4O24_05925 [Croceicoccus marinus]